MFLPQKYVLPNTVINPASTTCPVTHLDVNSLGVINSARIPNLVFTNVDGTYKPSNFLIISRTPLTTEDPYTYVAFSPYFVPNKSKIFMNYDFALTNNNEIGLSESVGSSAATVTVTNKNNGSSGGGGGGVGSPTSNGGAAGSSSTVSKTAGSLADNSASSVKPLSGISSADDQASTASATSNGASAAAAKMQEKLPFGSNMNPLAPDPFKFVHLAPGCNNEYVALHINPAFAEEARKKKKSTLFGNSTAGPQFSKNYAVFEINSTKLSNPKTALLRNASSFLSRAFPTDNFNKKLCASNAVVFNYNGKVFNMYSVKKNENANIPVNEVIEDSPILRVVFVSTVSCVCHRLSKNSPTTDNSDWKLDILIGFISGDIFWYDPFTNKYTRFNKNGKLLPGSAVLSLSWCVDGKSFFASFSDGSVMRFSRDSEDDANHFNGIASAASEQKKFVRVVKPFTETSQNPAAHYKFSKSPVTSLTQFATSAVHNTKIPMVIPELETLCNITCDDGYSRIFDFAKEQVTDVIPSHFGGVFCSSWSPDGRFLAIGGEDDLISMYEILAGNGTVKFRLVARLEGHYSWVRSIQFDHLKSPPSLVTSPINYRLASVGDDGKLILWDFTPKLLPKVKRQSKSKTRKRSNTASSKKEAATQYPMAQQRQTSGILQSLAGNLQNVSISETLQPAVVVGAEKAVCEPYVHDREAKNLTPFVQPMVVVECELGRLARVQFTDDGLWVTSSGGDIRKWERPA